MSHKQITLDPLGLSLLRLLVEADDNLRAHYDPTALYPTWTRAVWDEMRQERIERDAEWDRCAQDLIAYLTAIPCPEIDMEVLRIEAGTPGAAQIAIGRHAIQLYREVYG